MLSLRLRAVTSTSSRVPLAACMSLQAKALSKTNAVIPLPGNTGRLVTVVIPLLSAAAQQPLIIYKRGSIITLKCIYCAIAGADIAGI
jgi:hypothetical protein